MIESCHSSAGGKACAFQRAFSRVGCTLSDKTVSASARSQEGSRAANAVEDKAASLLMALIAAGGLSWFALSSSVSAAEVQDNLPHLHPVAADLGQLAESVSSFLPWFLLSGQASYRQMSFISFPSIQSCSHLATALSVDSCSHNWPLSEPWQANV